MKTGPAVALVAALVATLLLTSCSSLSLQQIPIGRSADGDDYRVVAEFPRADRITPGTEVRLGQLMVGRVHDLSTDGRTAYVGLSLSQAVSVPSTVTAAIELPSALGTPFIRLTTPPAVPGSPPAAPLTDGAHITDTDIGPELEASLAALGTVMNGSGFDQLRTIVTELNDAFAGRGSDVGDMMDRTGAILAAVNAHREDFDRTLDAAAAVASALRRDQEILVRGLAVAAPTMELLVRQRDRIAELMDTTSALADRARDIIADNSTRLTSGVDDLGLVLASMRGFNEQVTPALTNMNQFIAGFTGAVHGDYLVFDGALDLPETVAELWDGGRLPPVSPAPTLEQLLTPGVS